MPYEVVKRGCSDSKPFAVVGPDGKNYGCHKTEARAYAQQRALYANEGKSKENHEKTAIKRENGMDFPPRDYAYVPDPMRPATWRLRLTETPGKISANQLVRAAAALSPKGYQGNRVEIPPAALSSVKRRLLAEFRRIKVDESEIPPHIKALDAQSEFMVWKDVRSGLLRWLAVYSNNFRDQDNPPEIITDKSHKRYVDLVDSGLVDYPELWLWHTPGTTWGKADWVAYSDGFALASGTVYPGWEKVAENVARYKGLKVSHGMPIPFLLYDEKAGDEIIYHITMEISVLPGVSAANKLTGFVVLGKGDINMALPKAKKNFLEEVGLDKEVIDRLEDGLKQARQAAEEAGMESKERSVEDYDDDDDNEDEDETEDEEESEESEDYGDDDSEDSDVAEKAKMESNDKVNWNSDENKRRRRKKPMTDSKVNWNSDKNPRSRNTNNKVNWNSDENKRRRKKKPTTDSKVNWNSDRRKEADVFVTRDEVAGVIVEVVSPLIESSQGLSELVSSLAKEVKMLKKEISELSDTDEERLARTKEVTPSLSLSDIIRQNLVGKEAAKVKGNSKLGHEGPVEAPAITNSDATMVPLINSFIEQSRRNGLSG